MRLPNKTLYFQSAKELEDYLHNDAEDGDFLLCYVYNGIDYMPYVFYCSEDKKDKWKI